jgi:hypothetical protein
MGVHRFLFHEGRTEVYQQLCRGDSYMFVKSKLCSLENQKEEGAGKSEVKSKSDERTRKKEEWS